MWKNIMVAAEYQCPTLQAVLHVVTRYFDFWQKRADILDERGGICVAGAWTERPVGFYRIQCSVL